MKKRASTASASAAPSGGSEIADLPNALSCFDELAERLASLRPAVFLDYDGTLTPIVDRPEDAIISASMRATVRKLARRYPVCVVSGRDRSVVQELMGIDNLIVAGSHGFDIWSPQGGAVEHQAATGFEGVLERVRVRLGEFVDTVAGTHIEFKRASIAVHFRLVVDDERHRVAELVDSLLAEHPDELKVTPGKMVYEIQPKVDWDKGKAVLHLLHALGLDGDDVMPVYLGDDLTDEDAFAALAGRGIGVLVADADDPELAGRRTAASYVLSSTRQVQKFLGEFARGF